MNRNLEILVIERTQELKARNEEIEKQNSKIALQNKQLSDTIQLKNRIFSLIAHDLRSPVVNILYMLNLLKEKEYKEKYDDFRQFEYTVCTAGDQSAREYAGMGKRPGR